MLRFVTHKFRTQSLNEVDQPFQYKSDDDRDSGTESDDENTEFEDSQENVDNTQSANFEDDSPANNGSVYCSRHPASGAPAVAPSPCCEESNHGYSERFGGVGNHRRRAFARRSMDTSISSCHSTNSVSSNAILMANGNSSDADDYAIGGVVALQKHVPSPILAMLDVDSALPSDSDHFEHHSSEEELEVINSSSGRRRKLRGGGGGGGGGATSDEENPDADESQEAESHQQQERRRQVKQILSASTLTTGFKLKYKCNNPSSREPSSPGTHQKSPKKLDPHEHHPHPYQPEKRKWSQANRRSFGESSAGSSDDEVRDLMCSPSAPVEFRTSPPAELLRPTRSTAAAARAALGQQTAASLATLTYVVDVSGGNVSYSSDLISTSSPAMLIHGPSGGHPARPPPTKLFHFSSSNFTPFEVCAVSPRKRHRQMTSTSYHHHHPYHPVPCHGGVGDGDGNSQNQIGNSRNSSGHPVQRPCLDFEKMQQMRDRAVSGWRTTRELSLIC